MDAGLQSGCEAAQVLLVYLKNWLVCLFGYLGDILVHFVLVTG